MRWTEGRNLESIVELLANNSLDVRPLITHRFLIDNAPAAYELITGKTEEPFLGVLLTYPTVSSEPASRVKLTEKATPATARPDTLAAGTSTPTKVKLGVLGAGNFATAVMLPALKKTENIELVGVLSGSGLSAAHAAQKFGFKYAAESFDQILIDSEINTVAILTRHDLHAEQAIAALRAGKHVFVEKPLALNSDQLSEIREQLQISNSQFLMTGFNRRFAPMAQKMRAFLSNRHEPMAADYRINAGFIPLTHWLHDPEIGGGRIIGEGCHFVDFLTFLVGEVPSISCRARFTRWGHLPRR